MNFLQGNICGVSSDENGGQSSMSLFALAFSLDAAHIADELLKGWAYRDGNKLVFAAERVILMALQFLFRTCYCA